MAVEMFNCLTLIFSIISVSYPSPPWSFRFILSTLSPSDVFEKSQTLLVDELSRCSLLGLSLYNFHPGSSLGLIPTAQCVEKIAGAINHAHQQIPAVVTGTGSGLTHTRSSTVKSVFKLRVPNLVLNSCKDVRLCRSTLFCGHKCSHGYVFVFIISRISTWCAARICNLSRNKF